MPTYTNTGNEDIAVIGVGVVKPGESLETNLPLSTAGLKEVVSAPTPLPTPLPETVEETN